MRVLTDSKYNKNIKSKTRFRRVLFHLGTKTSNCTSSSGLNYKVKPLLNTQATDPFLHERNNISTEHCRESDNVNSI